VGGVGERVEPSEGHCDSAVAAVDTTRTRVMPSGPHGITALKFGCASGDGPFTNLSGHPALGLQPSHILVRPPETKLSSLAKLPSSARRRPVTS
jgi:hypothetical protein